LASLLRHGADPNERSPSDMVTGAAATDLLTESDVYPPVTPLHAACALGDEIAVDRLLAAGADPTLGLDDGRRPIDAAAERGAASIVRTRSLFSAASIDPRPRAVELLLAAGADPNVGDSRAMTPLHDAASRGGGEIARLLWAAGPDRRARSSAGGSAAMFARRARAGALAAALETDGETIADRRRAELFRALDKNDVAEFEALLKAGADPNGRGPGYDNGKDLLGRPILLHA